MEKKLLKKLPYIILALSALLLAVRAFFGFCSSDEPFYISTAKRFWQGDLIFAEEWFPTQLSSLILLPFYGLFSCITSGTEGIILYFRLLYLAVALICSLISYRILLDRTSALTALACSSFLLIYAHLNIATMSYYAMTFLFFIFSMILISRHSAVSLLFGGFIFALAVLSLPSLAIAYVVVLIPLSVFSFRCRELRSGLFLTSAGIAFALFLFLVYLYLSGNSIRSLFEFLPTVLADEEHQTSVIAPFRKFFDSISDVYGKIFYLHFLLAAAAAASHRFRRLVPFVFSADLLLFLYEIFLSSGHVGYSNTALALFAGPVFFLCEKKDWYAFCSLFMGGLVLSMTFSYSSNGELYVLSIGHGVSCIASILFLGEFASENRSFLKYLPVFCICAFLLQTFLLRFSFVYRDAPLYSLTETIPAGPAKGLHTTPEHLETYLSLLETIQKYDKAEGTVLFSKLLPWGYLASDRRCAGPTTWRNLISSEMLQSYLDLYPERVPDTVFIQDPDVGSYETCGDILGDPAPNENNLSGPFWKLLESDYLAQREKYCTVYFKNP